MKKKWITVFILLTLIVLVGCKTKHEYPSEVTQNFMTECQKSSGGKQKMCSCLLDKIQEKYSLEEFSIIEVKIQVGQPPSDFLELMDKAKIQCNEQ